MPKYQVEDIRNIVICGHGSSGKTMLVDRMLTQTGTVTRLANVDDGTSICDFDEEEKNHKYTIEASVVHFDYAGKRFNVIDTPGYPDFIGQTIGAMRGVDTALIAINALSGIEVNTRRVFNEAKKAGLGRIIVLNRVRETPRKHSGAFRQGMRIVQRAARARAAFPRRGRLAQAARRYRRRVGRSRRNQRIAAGNDHRSR